MNFRIKTPAQQNLLLKSRFSNIIYFVYVHEKREHFVGTELRSWGKEEIPIE